MAPEDDFGELTPELYERLKGIARHLLRQFRLEHEMEPGDLVHQFYAREPKPVNWSLEALVPSAARYMQFAVIDRSKRSRPYVPLSAKYPGLSYEESFDLRLSIDQTLAEYKAREPQGAKILALRTEGYTWTEIADIVKWPYPPPPHKSWYFLRREKEALAELFESHLRQFPSRPIPAWPWPPEYHYWPERRLRREWRVAAGYLDLQLGRSVDWKILLEEIYDILATTPPRVLYLTDLGQLARAARCSSDDVLAALTYLTQPPRALLHMQLREGSEKGRIVSTEEMMTKMREWHRTKTIPDHEWQSWTSNIWVTWTEQARRAS